MFTELIGTSSYTGMSTLQTGMESAQYHNYGNQTNGGMLTIAKPSVHLQWNLSYSNPLEPGVAHKYEKSVSLKLHVYI